MKFTLASILSIASVALLSLSSVQSVVLPIVAEAPTLEKREIMGLNNYACKLTKAHPRPVILVHATLLTLDSWKDFVPTLVTAGHSQGGILGRDWIKYLGGKGKVNKMIGVSPINHGTTLSNIVTVAKAFGVFTSGQATFDKISPSFYQMVNTSPFITKLNKGGDVAPGVITSNIASKFDQFVSPYESCFQEKAGVTNQLLQDLCMVSLNEHLTMVNSKVVLRWIMNQLDPSTAKTANCLSMF
ncbi:hypothetical protein BG006_008079 [Podila minutissima]|uniref:Uncharacterized protein n=1 Tax=Podila minutissima TaxID=64525 RepID=A0A9P5SIV8_9FUNG|nr:hypothetical protein BG006_008079 [Podila minutissima]